MERGWDELFKSLAMNITRIAQLTTNTVIHKIEVIEIHPATLISMRGVF